MKLYLKGVGEGGGVVKEESSFQARLFHNFKYNYFQKFSGEGSTLSIVLWKKLRVKFVSLFGLWDLEWI